MIIVDGATSTSCGTASNATGPFYCPPDETVYVDPTFFSILREQYDTTAGPLAQLYVLAHEYGHHIQQITGIFDRYPSNGTGPYSNGVRSELPRFVADLDADAYKRLPEWSNESFAGVLLNVAAGRVSNRMDFGGLNFTIDAACASSLAALAGGGLTAMLYGGLTPEAFLARLQAAISVHHVWVGLIKAPFMALIVGIVAAVEGMKVGGSAESLGLHVTASVVKSIFLVILMDAMFAIFYAAIGYLPLPPGRDAGRP